MAQAWLDAGEDLGIRVQHPFTFTSRRGDSATTKGVYLPDFGSAAGALLTCRFDPDSIYAIADDTDFFRSSLNPDLYEPYDRRIFVEALNDWGWFGDLSQVPSWFQGGVRKHGGAA